MGVHLGMSGRVIVDGVEAGDPLVYASNRDVAKWHRFGVYFADGGSFMLRDPRRLGAVELDPDEARLGPDAMSLTFKQLDHALGTRTAPVKAVLMDQARIAGLGNLLVDEALWQAGIDPARPAGAIDADERRTLHKAIRRTLRVLTRRGGSHTGDMPAGPGRAVPARRRTAAPPHDRRPHDLLLFRASALTIRPTCARGSWWRTVSPNKGGARARKVVASVVVGCPVDRGRAGARRVRERHEVGDHFHDDCGHGQLWLVARADREDARPGRHRHDDQDRHRARRLQMHRAVHPDTRVDEYKVYQAFIDDLNAKGGIAGRKIIPDYKTFCPIVPAPALALCTSFTEDDHVFAVLGDFVDLTGQAQPCIAKQHKTILITFNLTKAEIDSSPPGLMLTFNAVQERRVAITLDLLKKEQTLKGKTVAVLGEATTAQSVKNILVPGLKAMGVKLGSTAILTISGADTTAASSQLESFVEKWKTEGVNTVFLSGLQVSAKQFVPELVKDMPGVQLLADNNTVSSYGQNLQNAGTRPNPYEGIISTAGLSSKHYDQSDNWKYCAAIYEKAFHKTAPNLETVVPGPRGHTLDISGSITDACTELTMFHDIGDRVGKYLNADNWTNVVNNYGKIRIMV